MIPSCPQACVIILIVTKRQVAFLGLLVMISNSGSSYAKAIAGQISVPTHITNMKILEIGSGMRKMIIQQKGRISVILEVNRYTIVFFKLSNILRPSSMPQIIEEKSSSKSTISAASLVISEPDMPIDIPMLACFIAGASFTPSPVTPTMQPNY